MPWKKSEPMEERIEFGLKGAGEGELSSAVPGVWDHGTNRLQVARAVFALGDSRDEGRIAPTAEQSSSIGREGGM
jgi:hypothetical protein